MSKEAEEEEEESLLNAVPPFVLAKTVLEKVPENAYVFY
jgi:hypothetical protein